MSNKGIEIKHYKVLTLSAAVEPNSVYYVLDQSTGRVKTYITDKSGIPIPLIDLTTIGSVLSLTGTGVTGTSQNPKVDIATFISSQLGNQVYLSSSDGKLQVNPISSPNSSITVSATSTELQLQLSAAIQSQISSALQPNANLSGLNNDIGFITLSDISLKLDKSTYVGNAQDLDTRIDILENGVPSNYSKIVYVNALSPITATIFDLNNPPTINDNLLKIDINNLYIGSDASTWVYNSSTLTYITKTIQSLSNFYLTGTTTDAGNTKTENISRVGSISASNFIGAGTGLTGNANALNIGGTASTITGTISESQVTGLVTDLASKQTTLVSGTNIKTVEGQSILGAGNIDLTKIDVGLANVDNTSDLLKPISTATQTALDLKVDKVTSKSLVLDTEITRLGTLVNYTHPANHPPSIITQDVSNRFVTDAQIASWNAIIGGSVFQTTWDASTNTPTLVSSVGTKGFYYIVSALGATNLDGVIDWKVGDWAIFDGTIWRKVDNTDAVSSVNNLTGAVLLDSSNVPDTSNKRYVTDSEKLAITHTNRIALDNVIGINTGDQDISGKEDISNKITAITGYSEILYPNEKATHDALNTKLNVSDLPTNLTLYPTNVVSDVSGYVVMVNDIHDIRYNTIAVDISTPAITTTAQLVSEIIADAGVLVGQPGVFNITTFGNIRRLSGSGTATFFFRVYHRDNAGIETLIGQSSNSDIVSSSSYLEFSAAMVWNDGDFLTTDRIVIKYYANRILSGTNPVYQFQFGGMIPVRTLLPVPFSVVAGEYELNTNKQNSLAVDGTGVKYPTVDAVNVGLAIKVDKVAGERLINAAEITKLSNQSGTNTGDNAINSNYSGLVSNATHTGDATGATALTVKGINGTLLSVLGTGILKNTTTTGVPSIAVASDFPILNQNTTGTAAGLSSNIAESQVTGLVTDLAGKEPSFSKNTAFNKNFGTVAGTVVEGGTLGSNAYSSTAFAPATGSANYIQNQNASAQSANMWISGSGKFGGVTTISTASAMSFNVFSSFLSTDKYYSSFLVGKAASANESGGFGYVYNSTTPLDSFFHLTPYGQTEGNWFKFTRSGNLGIGVIGIPTEKLHIVGNGLFTGSITATSFNGSATLTGTPTAPTATAGTNTTQIATTAFVKNSLVANTGGVLLSTATQVQNNAVGEIIHYSVKINANTLAANDRIYIEAFFTRDNTYINNIVTKFYINTVNSLIGAIQIATGNLVTQLSQKMIRSFFIRDTSIVSTLRGINLQANNDYGGDEFTSTTINRAADLYIIITSEVLTTGDSATSESAFIQLNRQGN